MSIYLPPNEILPIFNGEEFDNNNTPLTLATGQKYFLRYPQAQGDENLWNVNINGTLTQIGNDNVTGNVTVIGNETITGNVTITGTRTQIGNDNVTGNVTVIGNETITGNVTITGTRTQIGNDNVTGNVTVIGNETITGNVTINSGNQLTFYNPSNTSSGYIYNPSTTTSSVLKFYSDWVTLNSAGNGITQIAGGSKLQLNDTTNTNYATLQQVTGAGYTVLALNSMNANGYIQLNTVSGVTITAGKPLYLNDTTSTTVSSIQQTTNTLTLSTSGKVAIQGNLSVSGTTTVPSITFPDLTNQTTAFTPASSISYYNAHPNLFIAGQSLSTVATSSGNYALPAFTTSVVLNLPTLPFANANLNMVTLEITYNSWKNNIPVLVGGTTNYITTPIPLYNTVVMLSVGVSNTYNGTINTYQLYAPTAFSATNGTYNTLQTYTWGSSSMQYTPINFNILNGNQIQITFQFAGFPNTLLGYWNWSDKVILSQNCSARIISSYIPTNSGTNNASTEPSYSHTAQNSFGGGAYFTPI